jgi:hypothetical protein
MHSLAVNQIVCQALTNHVRQRPEEVIDVALIGSVSGHYGWSQSRLLDIDIWILAQGRLLEATRAWAASVSEEIRTQLGADIKFERRAINGPYKPEPTLGTDTALVHLLIDDDVSYESRSALTRFSWRKYRPVVQPDRLAALSPPRPTASDLLSNKWGPICGAQAIREGRIVMEEIDLEGGALTERVFTSGSFQFREFCTYAVMMGARNRARIDGRDEADILQNLAFGTWYEEVYGDGYVAEIVEYKRKTSDGVDLSAGEGDLRAKTAAWCDSLASELRLGEI